MEDKKKRGLLICLVVFLLVLAFGIVAYCVFSANSKDGVVSNNTTKEIQSYIDALDIELSSSDLDGMRYLDEIKDLKVEVPEIIDEEQSFININEKKVDSGSFEVKSGNDVETYYYLNGKFSSGEELGHD